MSRGNAHLIIIILPAQLNSTHIFVQNQERSWSRFIISKSWGKKME